MSEGPSKKQKSEASEAVVEEQIDPNLQRLMDIQEKIDKIGEECAVEIVEIEKKYNLKKKPFFEDRTKAIKSVPEFWVTAFKNHPSFTEAIREEDEELLKYVEELDVVETSTEDQTEGFSVILKLKTNPFLEDKIVKKECKWNQHGPIPIDGPKLKWKKGMDSKFTEGFFFELWINPESDAVAAIIKDEIWTDPIQYYLGEDDVEEGEEGGEEEGEQ